jgi:TRAP transporter TAXI family solute receptor
MSVRRPVGCANIGWHQHSLQHIAGESMKADPETALRATSLIILLALIGAACGTTNAAHSTAQTDLRLMTGLPGAGFQPLGEALAREYRRSWPDVVLQLHESGGSVSNVQAIQHGRADLGFAFADVAYIAFSGRLDGYPFNRLRGIAELELTPLHLVVRAQSAIQDVVDLRGRRVGLGPPGSGTALTAGLVLEAFGFGPDEFHAQNLPFNDAAARLLDGTLDAMFVNARYPAESVRIATSAGARLLPLRGGAIDRLRHDYPFLRLTKIPAGTYPGHANPVHTVGVDTLLVCRDDLDESLVYEFTRTFFQVLPAVSRVHQSLRLMDLDKAPATPIPLHEGAARYYRERELLR